MGHGAAVLPWTLVSMFEIVYKMFLITLGNGAIIAKLSCDADSLRGDFQELAFLFVVVFWFIPLELSDFLCFPLVCVPPSLFFLCLVISGGSSLLREWWGAGIGCPERLWMLHPWRCSRSGWMGPWAVLCGLEFDDPLGLFQPKIFHDPIILWVQSLHCNSISVYCQQHISL